ncbi:MAG: carbon monoxide dehydrogenase subunit G, partial [Alphaproteobacteria bacterium]|nr:carbon monoxide dehydrogenase subunit G [Alphaproteobacteria bacterium]
MDLTGERRIAAPRERVFQALNDPDRLAAALPGCESLTRVSDTEFAAVATAKVGPIAARFTGKVVLEEVEAPVRYRLRGEGKGGAAGLASGEAEVTLHEDGGATVLRYTARAKVSGKLAQLGQRVVDTAARSIADSFFTRFAADLEAREAPPPAP